ncbi:hypothetical protein HPC49_14370 [Pyxidicoccus fallax]|uniref:Uncharacterized protein n=1 Tax=Pyxidicoccus fallax TaxID=394095 RepID=A0A848LK97_9BACT|nr:hypothetical protein [Pyxidicoccus fallax]NMO18122.1 hypothetical protein [Pyxidicoccus fallax]NPC79416.1 hypothetical protein [Pyxidicoccus fallax]
MDYPAITGWSREEREALVAAHRDSLAVLLRHSLSWVAAPYGEERLLEAFRFNTLDDAVDWCLTRFATGDLDPAKISPSSRSWRLFTEARFWLTQRESREGYTRKMQWLEAQRQRSNEASPTPLQEGAEQTQDVDVTRLMERLAHTLRKLLARTCPDLVGWWLRATEELRAEWFELPSLPPSQVPASKKTRSVRMHDAQFRFQCLHRALILDSSEAGLPHLAVREWLFQPCSNVPSYQRSEEDIAAALPPTAPRDRRSVQRLRREGLEVLLGRLLKTALAGPDSEQAVALMEWELLRRAVTKTTLTAFNLDEGAAPELRKKAEQLDTLAKALEVVR